MSTHHPIVSITKETQEDLWGWSPYTDMTIKSPDFQWLGWNSGLEEYSTIIFTYPVAWIAILVLPLGYSVQFIYYLFKGDMNSATRVLEEGWTSYLKNLYLFFYVPFRIVWDLFAVITGVFWYIIQFWWWFAFSFVWQAFMLIFGWSFYPIFYVCNFLIYTNNLFEYVVMNWDYLN